MNNTTSVTTKSRWEQIGAAGGILFVVLQLVSQMLIQIGGSEPPFDSSAEVIVDYFMNRNLFLMAGWDDPLFDDRSSFLFGGGVTWNDEDLKYSLGLVSAAN